MDLTLLQTAEPEWLFLPPVEPVERVIRRPGEPSLLQGGGRCEQSRCIGCRKPRCMFFETGEWGGGALEQFPADPVAAVCPTGALYWDSALERPGSNPKACIACGLCAERCPLGAIFLEEGARVHAHEEQRERLPFSPANREAQVRAVRRAQGAQREGSVFRDPARQVKRVYAMLADQYRQGGLPGQFPNRLVRNLLTCVGNPCAIRRQGDVNLRMDGIFHRPGAYPGVVEVEFTQDALESPRALLDDVAVLHARHGVGREGIIPLAVYLNLPHARAGHWQVVQDIRNVLGIRIQTLTVGALLLLLWSRSELDFSRQDFYLDLEDMSLGRRLERECGIPAREPIPAFEPQK